MTPDRMAIVSAAAALVMTLLFVAALMRSVLFARDSHYRTTA